MKDCFVCCTRKNMNNYKKIFIYVTKKKNEQKHESLNIS